MHQWYLHGEDSAWIRLRATLQDSGVRAGGRPGMPSLQLGLLWEDVGQGANSVKDAHQSVLAYSVDLFSESGIVSEGSWGSTGLITRRGHQEATLALTYTIIEELNRCAATRGDRIVLFQLSIQALVRDPDGNIRSYVSSGPSSVSVDAVRWHDFLHTWGYPATRVVFMPLQAPVSISEGNAKATEWWNASVQALLSAHNKWTGHDSQGAGTQLRYAVELAVRTWGALWFPEIEMDHETWNNISDRIGRAIPNLDISKGTLSGYRTPDIDRIHGRWLLLRHLNALAHGFHHQPGGHPVYTQADADMLITTATAVLRNLIDFWETYPCPPAEYGA